MFARSQSPLLIRKKINSANSIYLTFDDGPNTQLTARVLDILEHSQSPSTFFVVGDRAALNRPLINRMKVEGHKLYSHSTDHSYLNFFKSKKTLRSWVLESIDQLAQITGEKSWGFRPPAGVLTPPLMEISQEENLPLYLWNHRFFDTQFRWSQSSAEKSLARMSPGDIVLLHDRQKSQYSEDFLKTLNFYVSQIKNKNLSCDRLD